MAGLEMKYFVLNPYKRDAYGRASNQAIRIYAQTIASTNQDLANDLIDWMDKIEDPDITPAPKERLCALCLKAEIDKLKAALHDAEAIGDFSEELRSRYRLKQEIERLEGEIDSLKAKNDLLCTAIDDQQRRRWEIKQDKICAEEERDKLKAESETTENEKSELMLKVTGLRTTASNLQADNKNLRKALEVIRDRSMSGPETLHAYRECVESLAFEALKESPIPTT